ncbi:MAG: phenylalanine--tRNA ligase subunit alpha [Acidobacteria bacterium]|nr:phenylalanine--tRNA ligase subunit alpha [Acidobacteriota bacterium]
MLENAHPLWEQFRQELQSVSSLGQWTQLRDRYLSRQRGLITLEVKKLGRLSAEERPSAGQRLNVLKVQVEKALENHYQLLKEQERFRQLQSERIDVTLPGYYPRRGRIHPLRRIQREMEEIFMRMGFQVALGPELEWDYYNFEALNMPPGHPARDTQDTLYITENLLLRTHTSPVQIRTMQQQPPPVRIVVPGKVFRRDAVDATHSPMFHQMEGLVVDAGITFADLKGTLEAFLKELFSPQTRVRFQPSYFPFVEPGAEVVISCIFCSGTGCRVCKQNGWIEVMGAGMVHPKVLQKVGYDPETYTGFAWGMGIDRIAMLKYQIDDLRIFFENDVRFLSQF